MNMEFKGVIWAEDINVNYRWSEYRQKRKEVPKLRPRMLPH